LVYMGSNARGDPFDVFGIIVEVTGLMHGICGPSLVLPKFRVFSVPATERMIFAFQPRTRHWAKVGVVRTLLLTLPLITKFLSRGL